MSNISKPKVILPSFKLENRIEFIRPPIQENCEEFASRGQWMLLNSVSSHFSVPPSSYAKSPYFISNSFNEVNPFSHSLDALESHDGNGSSLLASKSNNAVMSGGSGADRRSKRGGGRAQGWEEAGGEFYQESYPGAAGSSDADLEVLHRDAAHLATLLPSKQAQHTIGRAVTSRRVRNEAKQTIRRRTSTRSRHSTTRRGSTTNDVHVSMLPDFTENLSNEERTWEEIMQIKAMPVSMAQKRELKAKLQSATKLRLQGFEQLKWQRRKFWQQLKGHWKEFYSNLELWQGSLKTIEGNFGTGVVAYFLFIKWLMFLNLAIFLLVFLVVVLPSALLEQAPPGECISSSNETIVECCTEIYANSTPVSENTVLDLFLGTGWMEKTQLFYGFYSNEIYHLDTSKYLKYDLPLAYVATAVLYFLLSLMVIVKSAAKGFKERLVEGEGQFYQYCYLVFGGWDFCIDNEKGAANKHKALFNEIKGCLEAERLEEEKHSRSSKERVRLFFLRAFVNLVIFAVLCGAGFLVFYVFNLSTEEMNSCASEIDDTVKTLCTLLYEYLPFIVIFGLNLTVPFLFSFLVNFEHYSPTFVIRISLMRTVLLRLASLAVFAISMYQRVSCSPTPDMTSSNYGPNQTEDLTYSCHCENSSMCWETYVGQKFYKFTLFNAAIGFAVTFFINFPRAFMARHARGNRIIRFIGEQEFELPKHVLDVVYSQTLCWMGSFYAPVLPALATIHCFLIFYIKKFACLVNSTPSSKVYRASRSNSLFMAVLLVSYVGAAVVVGFSLAEVVPSKGCGPFRGEDSVWAKVVSTFSQLPEWIRAIADFLGTAGFAVPAIVVLILALYYYYAVTAANRQMVQVLRHQLVLEGHDKQFLLNRLSIIIKQQQERSKPRSLSAAPGLAGETDISETS